MSARSDAELVSGVLSGHRECFAHLVDRHRSRVYSVMLHAVGDRDMAEDLTQETFLKAYRNLANYDSSRAKFPTWLLTIASRLRVDAHRRARPERSLDQMSADQGFDPASEERTERALEAAAVGQAVRAAIQRLPERQRVAVILKHIEDMPFAEIAQIMGCTVNSAKVHAHRGRNRLAQLLGHVREEELQ
ncbi:MAG: sigma-70 family RNA polymerase sigma factor [candidate division WS1 bacterium]|nr:sigma-70 family RNA polymerase sigma factor [candidate division WS1 bacterium]